MNKYYVIIHRAPDNQCLIYFPGLGYELISRGPVEELQQEASILLGRVLQDRQRYGLPSPASISFTETLDMALPGDGVYEIEPAYSKGKL